MRTPCAPGPARHHDDVWAVGWPLWSCLGRQEPRKPARTLQGRKKLTAASLAPKRQTSRLSRAARRRDSRGLDGHIAYRIAPFYGNGRRSLGRRHLECANVTHLDHLPAGDSRSTKLRPGWRPSHEETGSGRSRPPVLQTCSAEPTDAEIPAVFGSLDGEHPATKNLAKSPGGGAIAFFAGVIYNHVRAA